MKARRTLLALLVSLVWVAPMSAAQPGDVLPDIAFKDTRDNSRKLSDYPDAKTFVLAFLGCECPINTAIMPSLTKLAEEYSKKGVVVIGVYSNTQDSLAKVTDHVRKHGVTFPCVKDFDAVIADIAGAERTPEVFVLDAKRVVRYRGRIDDQYGFLKTGQSFARNEPTKNDLRDAVDAVLAGKPVANSTTEVQGCRIGRPRKAVGSTEVTYAQHIAPILFKNCTGCHRPGEIGPFSLLTYDDAAGWGEMIQEVVREQRMPPWHADGEHGRFSNARGLSPADIETITKWVDAGMPSGDLSTAPQPPSFPEGWTIGKPTHVFTMSKPFRVPARGTIDYQWITIDPQLKEDMWVSAVEIRPGARKVVHHVLAFLVQPGARRPTEGAEAGFFAAYVPGYNAIPFPLGYGKKIPAGWKIMLQMHYTTNGTAAEDVTSVGVIASKEPLKEMQTLGAMNGRLFLPAGEPNVEIKSQHRFGQDVTLYTLMPHTHLRGKAFRFEVEFPDGKTEMLLNIPRYDFNWQTAYELSEPKPLPKGSILRCTAWYDNSAENPNNPNPKVDVRWGPQTWDEMMIGYFHYVAATGKPEPPGGIEGQAERRRFLLAMFTLLDKNKDGMIEDSEVPEAQKQTFRRLLARFDENEDGKLSKTEIPGLTD